MTDKEKAVFFRDALRKAVVIIDDIVGQECCTYGHSDEIEELTLIANNRRKCPHLYVDSDGWDMCRKYDVFCAPKFDGCKTDCILFPEDEEVSNAQ